MEISNWLLKSAPNEYLQIGVTSHMHTSCDTPQQKKKKQKHLPVYDNIQPTIDH